jgi:hypothetical protein
MNTRIVHQYMQRLARCEKTIREIVDRRRIPQIERFKRPIRMRLQRLSCPVEIARRDDDLCAGRCERLCGLEADARITAGDDGDLAGEIIALNDLLAVEAAPKPGPMGVCDVDIANSFAVLENMLPMRRDSECL